MGEQRGVRRRPDEVGEQWGVRRSPDEVGEQESYILLSDVSRSPNKLSQAFKETVARDFVAMFFPS